MFVGAFFRTRNILTHTHSSFLEQAIFTCLFICVGDNIKLYIGESTLDVGEQTVGETTHRRNDWLPTHQAPVVQRLDNAIHQINHYPVDSMVCFVNTYPLDSD